MRAAADAELRSEIEQLLYHEAWLLDRGRLDEWLGLYTDDATYWIPLQANQADPLTTSSIVYDDRRLLEVRVRQFQHPRAHARVPAPRTRSETSGCWKPTAPTRAWARRSCWSSTGASASACGAPWSSIACAAPPRDCGSPRSGSTS